MTMHIYDMMITMIFMWALRQKYIDCYPTASMTNNPPPGCHTEFPVGIKLQATDNRIK